MDKSGVTDVLEEIAVLLELKGENPFKARAYTNAARTLDNFEGELETLVAEKRLGELAGVGDALQAKDHRVGHDRAAQILRGLARLRAARACSR